MGSHLTSNTTSVIKHIYHADIDFMVIILLRNFSYAAVSIKISNIHISFSSFDMSCLILEKDNNFIENLYIVLSCLVKYCSFLTLFVSILFRTLAVLSVLGARQRKQIYCINEEIRDNPDMVLIEMKYLSIYLSLFLSLYIYMCVCVCVCMCVCIYTHTQHSSLNAGIIDISVSDSLSVYMVTGCTQFSNILTV